MDKTIFLLAIPQGTRIALAGLLLLTIFRPAVLWIVKYVVLSGAFIINKVLSLIFFLIEHIIVFIVYTVLRRESSGFLRYESFVSETLKNMLKFSVWWKGIFTNKQVIRKRYRIITIAMFVVYIGCQWKWPTYPVIQATTNWETKFLQEKLGAPNIETKIAQEKVIAFMKSQKVIADKVEPQLQVTEVETKELKLKSIYDGGNIREQAHKNAKIVTSISRNETVIYLGEETLDDENRIWYKVRTKTNFTGWISSIIVE